MLFSFRTEAKRLHTTMPMTALLLLCAVVILPSVDSIAHSMGKRSDDPNPLESVVLRLSSDVESLKAWVSQLAAKLGTSLVSSRFIHCSVC